MNFWNKKTFCKKVFVKCRKRFAKKFQHLKNAKKFL